MDIKLNSPLQYFKGVGPKKAQVLAQFGMHTVRDLLGYYPRQYLDRTSVLPIKKLKIDESATIIGEVKAHGVLYGKRRRYEVILGDESGTITLVWFFGIPYWERMFKKGLKIAATGRVTYYGGMQMVHPELERLEEETDKMVHAGRIIPVYPQTSELSKVSLNSRGIRRLTTLIFENLKETIPDILPEQECKKQNLMPLNQAISKIHYPDSRDDIELCRRRLAFDELLGFQFMVQQSRRSKEAAVKKHKYKKPGQRLTTFKKSLPFELTTGQKEVTREIFADLQSKHPMSRLLQGDVGCGKTVVAILASLYVAENDLQTAFMAPTEILAEQHYANWSAPLAELGVKTALLTSSLKAAEKKKIAAACAEGEIDLLFGTHALVYDYVTFRKLGLVIIDEQHRFGVEQRGKLFAKGDNPDLLIMTATPIPRTLALTLYGDLRISTITTLPPGRKEIRTVWRAAKVKDKVFEFVRDEIKKGGQAYIIYPLIDKSEQMDLENVEDAYKELSTTVFKTLKVGMIHGRVKPKERDQILKEFYDGQLNILMATTVIEVGIDNPNATIMVIEHAERFGLAQLHQLRGRIGRGRSQATLVALAHQPISEIGRQRLEYFVSTTDGFKISEADLELRGPGEIFGLRQSGLPELKAANLSKDQDLLESSRNLLLRLFENKAQLDSGYARLYKYLEGAARARQVQLGGG